MIPIRDNIPSRTFPIVNYALIGISSVVFLIQVGSGRDTVLVERFGMIPARVLDPDTPVKVPEERLFRTAWGTIVPEVEYRELAPSAVPPWLTLLTCIFLHGGWLHAIGNLWFLHIFGDNVEDRLGHVGYLFFYLFCGVAASAAHLLAGPQSPIPTIGASGAIAGVMGAYFVLYPRAMVLSIIPIFFFFHMMVIPAPVFLGFWFVLQFFQGTLAITSTESGGVAWWAHIGGFAVGLIIALLVKATHVAKPAVTSVRPHTERPTVYRIHRRFD